MTSIIKIKNRCLILSNDGDFISTLNSYREKHQIPIHPWMIEPEKVTNLINDEYRSKHLKKVA